jgi:hypothetical protein
MNHNCLPNSLTPELLGEWLVKNAREKFTEERKIYYSEEELQEFKDKAVASGIELNNLASLKARVSKLLDNGNPEPLTEEIPETKGIKVLKDNREVCEKEVEKGYFIEEIKIYGIPNQETNTMDFFDIEGREILERSRQLSAKEIRDFFGMFAINQESKQA